MWRRRRPSVHAKDPHQADDSQTGTLANRRNHGNRMQALRHSVRGTEHDFCAILNDTGNSESLRDGACLFLRKKTPGSYESPMARDATSSIPSSCASMLTPYHGEEWSRCISILHIIHRIGAVLTLYSVHVKINHLISDDLDISV